MQHATAIITVHTLENVGGLTLRVGLGMLLSLSTSTISPHNYYHSFIQWSLRSTWSFLEEVWMCLCMQRGGENWREGGMRRGRVLSWSHIQTQVLVVGWSHTLNSISFVPVQRLGTRESLKLARRKLLHPTSMKHFNCKLSCLGCFLIGFHVVLHKH